jgi:hypothetical protein
MKLEAEPVFDAANALLEGEKPAPAEPIVMN